ncbi:MAG: hypothetical protein ACLGPL_00125 [Acidobacteriota bacterium]|jgi:hypothetical protein
MLKIANPYYLVPGTVVSVRVGFFFHVGIVSDRHDCNGLPYVISNSARVGRGAEESWDVFSGGKTVYQEIGLESALPWPFVLVRAGNLMPKKWDLLSWNCEHFVREALGIKVESPQLQSAIAFGAFLSFFCLVKK